MCLGEKFYRSRKQQSWQNLKTGYYSLIVLLAYVESSFSTSGYMSRSKSQSQHTFPLLVWISTTNVELNTYSIFIKFIGLCISYQLQKIKSTCIASSHHIIQLLGLSVITLSTFDRNKTRDSTLLKGIPFAHGNDSFCEVAHLHWKETKRPNYSQQSKLCHCC